MAITYGVIYNYIQIVILLTILESLLLAKRIRIRLYRFITRHKLTLENQYVYTLLYFAFVVLASVLMDSGWAFMSAYSVFQDKQSKSTNI
jgi:hypothetical protein